MRNALLGFCLIAAFIFWIAFRQDPSSMRRFEPAITSPAYTPERQKPTEAEFKPEVWRYSDSEDNMGRKRSFASTTSTNTLSFSFPYQGEQRGTLMIRSTNGSLNVMVSIEKGQILCGIDSCKVPVRFDNGPIQTYSASPPSDHSSTMLFLNNEARFVAAARKSKKAVIELTVYQEGPQSLKFEVEGLKWNNK